MQESQWNRKLKSLLFGSRLTAHKQTTYLQYILHTVLWSTWGRLQGQPSYSAYEPVNNKELQNATQLESNLEFIRKGNEGYWFPWGHRTRFHDSLARREKWSNLFRTFYFSLANSLKVTTPINNAEMLTLQTGCSRYSTVHSCATFLDNCGSFYNQQALLK